MLNHKFVGLETHQGKQGPQPWDGRYDANFKRLATTSAASHRATQTVEICTSADGPKHIDFMLQFTGSVLRTSSGGSASDDLQAAIKSILVKHAGPDEQFPIIMSYQSQAEPYMLEIADCLQMAFGDRAVAHAHGDCCSTFVNLYCLVDGSILSSLDRKDSAYYMSACTSGVLTCCTLWQD